MFNFLLLTSPFEQFDILNLISLFATFKSGNYSIISISVLSIFMAITFFALTLSFYFSSNSTNTFLFKFNGINLFLNGLRDSLRQIAEAQLSKKHQEYFLMFLVVYIYVFTCNVSGLIPYTFTWTSHFTTTLALSGIYFFGNVFLAFFFRGYKFIGIFLPSGGISLAVKFILAVVEVVSYIARLFSLSIRLCANMMAGHTLLKFIVGFCWMNFLEKSIIFFIIPVILLTCVYMLEIVVALLQSFVFGVLGIIYINDSITKGAH